MNDDILRSLQADQIRFLRVVWCDNANVIRGKAIHRDAFGGAQEGVGLSAAQQAIPVMADAVAPGSGLGPVGEVWLVPDWATLQRLPYAPGHARVMGDMVRAGEPWPWCGRQFLKRMIGQAAGLGLEIKAAFEPEFYLLRHENGQILPADTTVFAASLAMDLQHGVINAIADALSAQGVLIEQYYPESGPGQQEISVCYTDALAAADQHIIYRETVRAVARQHGLVASFVPKVFEAAAGSGCHLHLSLWRDGGNITGNGSGALSSTTQAFTAGLLTHLPALMALTAPSTNSYRRLQPHFWSGAFRAWGYDNREAAIRVPSNPAPPSPTHIELKTVDGAANPYLALGGAIAAGLDGLQQNLPLPEPIDCDPGTLSEAERSARQIDRLPTDLKTAIHALRQNLPLTQALGEPLAQTYLAVRQAEWDAMKDLDLEGEVRMLLERY
ncbi:glutamine synthetase family protein [Pseudanabaena sp. FACHB-2040]|uniref:glutamine synthetase family protein n=1 Tax=Pseudanabaena sp. FACHB-2040 TaxID=2692859 RepID=UPI0016830882|nr:glutamine synthetase family protein [Pseudanabaena sp. FACHB-2040]MBD2260263.1 glutamine synthetase [Pseudanabaena sp. FACHB-2040]